MGKTSTGTALEFVGEARGLTNKRALRLNQPWNLIFLLCLLILKVGHEPMPPTIGTNVLGRKVLYLPSFFTYGECASKAGKPTRAKQKRPTRDTLGSMKPRVRAGLEEGIKQCGQRQQGVRVGTSEQYNCGAAPLPTAAAISPGSRRGDRCLRERPVQDTGSCHPCCSRLCLEWGWWAFLLPSQRSGPVTSFSAFCLL